MYKAAHVAIVVTLALGVTDARIISTKKSDDSLTPEQSSKKWSFANLDQQQTSELEKLIKQSLENIFKNEEIGQNKEVDVEITETKPEVDEEFSSPHILKVPVPQPYPVHIPVKQPFTVPIFKLVPEEVEKKVPITVEKLVPNYKEKPVQIIVEKHHPVPVYKPYVVPVAVNTHILLPKKKEEKRWY
ncbi:uncharacterized protein LOC103315057 [Tribolium castaneum]|uniref:Uncharacterized protein n=1 Tax=Tribolium castaneum TaxID=7070 RepID=D6W9E1_TRICA|nr:PREDICTED: uncharacterized protein LOC103315057 [Tribolium castaneum]EEZ98486.1 hypothetical protein TcasGA2_TC000980 [Tribolium castaneum]|eukprot:XP_008201007.1 PREDICTED: uncharacterized protein LOC103315057 [Tribolium castaneum]